MNLFIHHRVGGPVIGDDIGGISEIVRGGGDGVLITADSFKEIIKKLVLLLMNPYLR